VVTAGQVHDCTQAIALLGERKAAWVLADKGYDSQQILDHIEAMGAVAVVPSKSNRKQQRSHDKELYRQRNRIERCFSRLKHSAASPPDMKSSKPTSKLSSHLPAPGSTFSYMSILPRQQTIALGGDLANRIIHRYGPSPSQHCWGFHAW
jgi:transposase